MSRFVSFWLCILIFSGRLSAVGGAFVQYDNSIGIKTFPAQYRATTNFLDPTDAYAARRLQLALKLIFLRRKCRDLLPKPHGMAANRHISLDLTHEPCNN
jgi:hypothetical protein